MAPVPLHRTPGQNDVPRATDRVQRATAGGSSRRSIDYRSDLRKDLKFKRA
jgi:hypothetical protein